jgi:NADH dehydrogenase
MQGEIATEISQDLRFLNMMRETSEKTRRTHIVILGGGFAGVEAARYLDRTVANRADVEVTLVNRDNFTLFTPMLDEVASGDLEPAQIGNPLRKLFRHVTVLSGEIKAIDLAARQVTLSYGIGLLTRELPFDHLVLALGSETNYSEIPGVAAHALGMKTLGDAVMLRAKVIAMLEAASIEPDLVRRKRMLTFVVAGSGFAGVETVGAINDLARESLPHYGRVDPREVRVVLIGGKAILPEIGEALGLYTHEKLRERQIEVKIGAKVIAYKEGAVHCSDSEAIPPRRWYGPQVSRPVLSSKTFPGNYKREKWLLIPLWKFLTLLVYGRWATAQRSSIRLQNFPILRLPSMLFARGGMQRRISVPV